MSELQENPELWRILLATLAEYRLFRKLVIIKPRVFISSPCVGLEKERTSAKQAIEGFTQVFLSEVADPSKLQLYEELEARLKMSHAMVGIVAEPCGSDHPDKSRNCTVSRWEYEEAIKSCPEVHMFVKKDVDEARMKPAQKEFRDDLLRRHLCGLYTTADNLADRITHAVESWYKPKWFPPHFLFSMTIGSLAGAFLALGTLLVCMYRMPSSALMGAALCLLVVFLLIIGFGVLNFKPPRL